MPNHYLLILQRWVAFAVLLKIAGTTNTSSYNNRSNQLSPTTPDTIEDLTSLDTSSGRTWNNNVDDTTDNNRLPYSRNNSSGSATRRRGSNTAEGGGSTTPNSYYNSPSNTADGEKSLSPHRGGNRQQAYNINLPADNVDEMDNDPRNPFNPGKSLVTVGGWTPSDYIPEEDENSLSTLDEHSVTPSLSQQTSSRSNNNLNVHMQSQNSRLSLRQQQQRQKQSNQQPQSIISDSDDGSISTHQSDFKRKNSSSRNNNNADKRLISQQTQIITQLELQVMKLNLDLATTKSSLDEIQLQNRKLQSDKDKLNETINSYQEENDQLHLLIERLEREKIIRNMDGTRGTIVSQQQRRPTDDSRVVWGHNSVSGHTWVADQLGDNDTTNQQQQQGIYTVTQQKLGKVSGGGGLEVPFRTEPKRRSSVSSFNELSTVGGDDMSHAASCNSVALSSQEQVIDESDKLDISSCQGEEDRSISLEEAMGSNRSGGGLLNMFGVPKAKKEPQSRQETTKKQTEDTYISPLSPVHNAGDDDDGDNDEYYTQSSGLSYHQQQDTATSERASNEPDMGSNPQGESLNDEDPFSTCDDDDPFATWSARGSSKREESEKPELNWLQRGLGGGRKRDDKKSTSRQPPQSQEEDIEDPFSTCKPLESGEEDGKYTSFVESDRDGNDSVVSISTNGPRRFGLFGRRRNS